MLCGEYSECRQCWHLKVVRAGCIRRKLNDVPSIQTKDLSFLVFEIEIFKMEIDAKILLAG